ncbi:MAG: FtsX-like permease family protein [Ardenticatenaceae bacterium]
MFSPRWRKVLRDLWSNKTRTLLVVLSIAVGVFAVGMIVSSQLILSRDLKASYLATRPAHAILFGQFDEEIVESIRRMDEIEEVEARGGTSAQFQVAPGDWRDARLTTIQDFEDIRVAQLTAVSGEWPPEERTMLIEQASLALAQAQVGDTVMVELTGGEQKELRVSGIVHDLGQPSAIFDPVIKVYITPETQAWLGVGDEFNELHILVTGDNTDKEHITAVAGEVQDKVERAGQEVGFVFIPEPGEHWADDALQSMLLILGALGFLSLGLSGFLVVNTISALLSQQVRQIGVMKAIGARTGQLARMYLASVLIFGALSLLVAVPLGALATHLFVNFIAGLMNFYDVAFRVPPRAIALETGVGLLVPLIASLWPVLGGARISVQEALNSYGLGKGNFGSHPLDRLLQRITFLPRPMLLSLRNTFRRKGRLFLTLSTLVLGGAIFVAVLSVHSSLIKTLDETLAYWSYDVDIRFTRPYRVDQLEEEALEVPGVTAVESWSSSGARRIRPDGSESPNLRVLAPPAETDMIRPTMLQGRWLLSEDENAIVVNSIVLDDDPDIKVGDEIILTMDGRESDWRVVGIAQGMLTGPIAYVNYPHFARVMRVVGRSSRIVVVADQPDPAYHLEVAAAVSDHFEDMGINVAAVETSAEVRANIVEQFNLIVIFLSIMAVLIAVVGALGLTGTMSINVLERAREIGVMRAIGASDGSVLRIFLVEGILIGLLSWIAGGILAVPIGKLLSDIVGVSFVDRPLSYEFSTDGVLLWLAIVFVLAALSSLWPAWRAARLTVRDVLAYE